MNSNPNFEMRTADLGELYALLSLYIRTYHTDERDSALLSEVTEKFRSQSALHTSGDNPPSLINIRGAGRKRIASPEVDDEILRLRHEGKTIREIAAATNRSAGYVHKLIHEQHSLNKT